MGIQGSGGGGDSAVGGVAGNHQSYRLISTGLTGTTKVEITGVPALGKVFRVIALPEAPATMISLDIFQVTALGELDKILAYTTAAKVDSAEDAEYDLVEAGQVSGATTRGSLFLNITVDSGPATVNFRIVVGPR